jgi:hypothetical protein
VSDESVELSEAIEVVREQLIKVQGTGRRSGTAGELTFVVGTVSVEFTGEVKRTVGVGGGVKFWVVNADAKGERASGTSQKVTVELTPQSADGTSYKVHDGVDAPPQR